MFEEGAGGGVENYVYRLLAVGEGVGVESVDDAELGDVDGAAVKGAAVGGDGDLGLAGDAVGEAVLGERQLAALVVDGYFAARGGGDAEGDGDTAEVVGGHEAVG